MLFSFYPRTFFRNKSSNGRGHKLTGKLYFGRQEGRVYMKISILFLIIFVIAGLLSGQHKKYPAAFYLVGEGAAENTGNPDDLTAAKQRAMGDLASQIQAQVKSEFVNEVTETSQSLNEYASSKVKVISEMRIDGVHWEIDRQKDYITAYAVLNKDEAAGLYATKNRRLSEQIKTNMGRINKLLQSAQNEKALQQLFETSKLFNEFEQNVLIYMILGGTETTEPPVARGELDDKIFSLTETDFKSFDDVINGLCFQISKQVTAGQRITIFPFDYQDTAFGSAFSDYVRRQISFSLAKFIRFQEEQVQPEKSPHGLTIAGTYWIKGEKMELLATLYDPSGKTFGSARVSFPIAYADQLGISYKPQNFDVASKTEGQFRKDEIVYGDLKVEFWTNKGERSLIFHEGEEMRLYVRVNKPAYIRFIYHLANGVRTPLYKSYYIDATKVNKTVELPDVFVCAPPLGTERLQIFASTQELPALNTTMTTIDGEEYEVLTEDIAHTRGMLKKKNTEAQVAERVITLTTVERNLRQK